MLAPVFASTLSAAAPLPHIVIGSGIGGLSCGCMLARDGKPVVVVESHYHAGGCAHGFEVGGFQFDSGPSLWAAMSRKSRASQLVTSYK